MKKALFLLFFCIFFIKYLVYLEKGCIFASSNKKNNNLIERRQLVNHCQRIMKTQNIYQVVIVKGDEIVLKYDVFCISLESLYNKINTIIADAEKDGYTIKDYDLHKWNERNYKGTWETVNHVKTMTHVSQWGIDKKTVGFITYKAA